MKVSNISELIEDYWKLWRKNAALPLLTCQIVAIYTSPLLYACLMPLWLTIPCGIKLVNQKRYLWYTRQLLFGIVSLAAILDIL